MEEQNKHGTKFLDRFLTGLIIGCMVLVVAHQTINVLDSRIPEPTPTRSTNYSSEYIGDGVIKDEDIIEQWFTPTPGS